VSADSGAPGRAVSRLIPDPQVAWEIYQRFKRSDALTVLINGIEFVDPSLRDLQDLFRIPFRWRMDDIVASLSTAGSGIGYHAGHEDGFIMQVQGSRRWRVWPDSLVSLNYRCSLLANDDSNEHPVVSRPDEPPLLDCILEPGDVLYNPAMYPHEGETIDESVSLSLAWQGVASYNILTAICGGEAAAALVTDENRSRLFSLLPDILPTSDTLSHLINHLTTVFSCLDERPTSSDLQHALRDLLSRNSVE
jgi:ribosomal protein L16 Arg81 hydroxylase